MVPEGTRFANRVRKRGSMSVRLTLLLALLLLAAPAQAKPEVYRASYVVRLYGLTLARTSFASTVEGDRFSVSGDIRSAGVGRIVDDTKGKASVSGRLVRGAAAPEAFRIAYTSGSKNKRTEIDFADGAVSRTENVPPLKPRGNWVPLRPADLKAAADPLSAVLVRAAGPQDVCARTLRYYDGELRADIVLSHVATGSFALPGYSGEAVTCSARFVPVAGYRKGNSTIEYLRRNGRIAIVFAPMGSSGLYAPVRASVGTKIGTVTVEAERFEPAR